MRNCHLNSEFALGLGGRAAGYKSYWSPVEKRFVRMPGPFPRPTHLVLAEIGQEGLVHALLVIERVAHEPRVPKFQHLSESV